MPQFEKTKVLLVYPKIPENTYWSFSYAMSFIGKKTAMPPLGLLTVAAMLPPEWHVRLVDENVEPCRKEHFAWADMVLLSAMNIQKESFAKVAAAAKAAGAIVVAGGPYVTQSYDRVENVDHFILGEAESGVLAAFLRDWCNGAAQRAYVAHTLRAKPDEGRLDQAEWQRLRAHFPESETVHVTKQRPDMDASPMPRYELLDLDAYASMSVQMSRGCPFACEFCSEPALFGHKPRVKSAGRILKELERLYELGYRGSVFFVDDNFIGNIRKATEALERIAQFQKKHGYPFQLYTEASVNLAQHEQLMDAMTAAGFNMVFVGLETPDRDALRTAGKEHNAATDLLRDVAAIQHHGMEVTAGFIVGFDKEKDGVCASIFEFCQKAGLPTAMVGLLVPAPGSLLYERLKQEGRLLEENPGGNNTHSFELGYRPDRDRDPNRIVADYKALIQKLYPADGRAYFERCRKLLAEIGAGPNVSRPVGISDIGTFLKSLTRQSMAKYGKAYRRFLVHAFLKRRHLFPEAVRLAVCGHHFITITNYALQADEIKQTLQVRMEILRTRIDAIRRSGVNLQQRWADFVGEQRKSLQTFRKKIAGLPADYRRDLNTVYQDLLERLNCLQELVAVT